MGSRNIGKIISFALCYRMKTERTVPIHDACLFAFFLWQVYEFSKRRIPIKIPMDMEYLLGLYCHRIIARNVLPAVLGI